MERTPEQRLFLAALAVDPDEPFPPSGPLLAGLAWPVACAWPVAATDHGARFLLGFLRWLRNPDGGRRRAVALAVAAFAVADRLRQGVHGSNRQLTAAALHRPDDPAALLDFWARAFPDRGVPSAVKRGIADRLPELFTEEAVWRWDRQDAPLRFADVLRTCQVKPNGRRQAERWQWIMDRAGGTVTPLLYTSLPSVRARHILDTVPQHQRADRLDSWVALAAMGATDPNVFEPSRAMITHEWLAAWLGITPDQCRAQWERLAGPPPAHRAHGLSPAARRTVHHIEAGEPHPWPWEAGAMVAPVERSQP